MNQADRRRQVLLAWAFVMRKRGEALPTNDELTQIAMMRAVPPGLRTPLVNRWAHVLHHLMWLSDQGHPDPVADALRMGPSGPAPAQPTGFPGPGPGPTGTMPPQPPRVAPPPPTPQTSFSPQTSFPPQPSFPPQSAPHSSLPPQQSPQQPVSPPSVPPEPAPPQGSEAGRAGTTTSPAGFGRERPRFSEQANRAIADLTAEIDQAGLTARTALTEGREDLARTWLVKRNELKERLGKLTRGGAPPEPETQQPAPQQPAPQQPAPQQPAPQQPAPQPPAPQQFGSTPPQPPSVPAAPQDPLQRLMMWRDGAGLHDLKDRHLRQIVNSGARNEQEVAAGLPASLKPLAGDIAKAMGLASPGPAAGAPGPVAAMPAPPSPDRRESRRGTPPQFLNENAVSWQQPIELANEVSRFAALDFSEPTGEPLPIKIAARGDGHTTLRWPPVTDAGRVVIFRVVSDDEHVPYSPDTSEVIGITSDLTFVDSRPPYSAVRHYQVWVNTGDSVEEAFLNQPRQHAKMPIVAKPSGVDIREDEGRIIGQWTVHSDVRAVRIYRVPAERAGSGAGNPDFRIGADEPNLGGFVDTQAQPGKRYLYQLLVEAEVEGSARLSLPEVVEITTSAVVAPVTDLACRLGADESKPEFTLDWTPPPAGRVVIYRTRLGPLAGAEADTVDESALPQMQLPLEDRLAHPIVLDEGRALMRDVPWPRGWSRTYFTPVTMIDGKARVGRTTSQVRTGKVEDAVVVERVTQQVLTMDWPDGAAAIKVYASVLGQSSEDAIPGAEAIAEISQEAYVRLGGLHFQRPLGGDGCDLHLLPISFAGGRAVEGRPTVVSYKGLLKLWYSMEVQRGRGNRGPVSVVIRIRADRPNPGAPPFALVHNAQRLPLDINDGDSVLVRPNAAPGTPSQRFRPPTLTTNWVDPGFLADLSGRAGWFRVFVDLAPDPNRGTVALLDPPVAQLFLDGR